MGKLITADDLRKLAGDAKQVVIPKGSILSPSALDLAKEMKISLHWGAPEDAINVSGSQCANAVSEKNIAAREPWGRQTTESRTDSSTLKFSQNEVVDVVRAVVGRMLKPACENPRVTHVKASAVVMEPFDQAPPGQKIMLKDVVTSREANLGAGFMSFDRSSFPWHLTYDEIDYVVEGTFTLQTGGKTYTCQAGDVMYIPKDTHVTFGSPAQAKVFYVTYPSNWSEV